MKPLSFILNNPHYRLNEPRRRGKSNAKYNRTYNNQNIITFDTETTSIVENGKYYSFVYIAMLCVNGQAYYTRNLSDIKIFLDRFNDETTNTINVIYVHNLGFDFAFLQNIIPFNSVFARAQHKPIFARYKNWEFRCSYFLSQMSLENVGKFYDLPHGKLVDGLNYRLRRHTKTLLSKSELQYCELDVMVLYEYIHYMLMNNGWNYRNIPYTQTGFVRKFILENAKRDKQYYRLRSIVENTKPSIELYNVFENCYTGGYTHANYLAVIKGLHTNVKSYDFTSSYPAVMCRCKFPIGKFKEICCNFERYLNDSENYCCVGLFRLDKIQAKSDLCYISAHKIVKKIGADGKKHSTMINGAVSNGRVFRADQLYIYLTNVDIESIKLMYDCTITPVRMWAARADYLPKTIIMSILELYGNKTKLKGIQDKKPLYLASKQMVNSVYGMAVFNAFCDTIEYNAGEWKPIPATPEQLYKYFKNRKTILPYQWGVFVTAWARNKLVNIASEIGNDVLYMDTDSIKFIGDHDKLFIDDNAKIHAENIAVAEKLNINPALFAPVDIENKSHELGLWDFEGVYKSFKVLGAKRYCYTVYGSADIFPVVAGCPTNAIKTWLKLHNCNALLKPFRLNAFLDCNESGKNTVHYHANHDIDIEITDYMGLKHTEHIGYGVCLEPTSFDMSFCPDYMKFITGYGNTNVNALIRNGVMME